MRILHVQTALGAVLAVAMAVSLAACGGNSVTLTPPRSSAVALASARSTTCVAASSTAQTVTLPDTGGVTATLQLGEFDSGGTGCANIVVATGADAAASTSATVRAIASRRTDTASDPKPIIAITLGEGLPSSLGIVTVANGATLQTDPNVVLPDGQYDATVTFSLLAGTPLTVSLVFTATNGKLTITGGNVPINLGAGAQLSIYAPGVVPPDFTLATPSPTPSPSPSESVSPSASPSGSSAPTEAPTVSPTPTPVPGQTVPDGTNVGSFTITAIEPYQTIPDDGTITYENGTPGTTTCNNNLGSGTAFQCTDVGDSLGAGYTAGTQASPSTTTYTLKNLDALSYRVDGCTGQVSYAGGGTDGTITFTASNDQLTTADTCEIDIFNEPASVVDADPNGGYQYDVFTVSGPVDQSSAPYPPAQPLFKTRK